ncbi:MAG: glycosyltransferase family 4 protein, partial [Rhodospirillales bacterium]|nr:glycosyltransferase family 4 protein [Rhodospirillales bacterium]
MRIAQVAPLHEAVPPKLYGGTERVVSYLTEQLVDMGHEVTLFASGDSITSARLVACCGEALRLSHCADPVMFHILQLEQIIREARDFDVIHFHTDYIHYCWARRSPVPTLTTLHGRQDLPQLIPLYKEFRDVPLSSISDAQRAPLPWVDWRGTIYHGLPESLLPFTARPEGYLAFLGRVSPEKRLDRAIAIAKRVGRPLKIAAKVDPADQDYFNTVIRSELDHPLIEFVGEIGECDKSAFLGNAAALLFPIDWPEPFGLVMIEAMACGT